MEKKEKDILKIFHTVWGIVCFLGGIALYLVRVIVYENLVATPMAWEWKPNEIYLIFFYLWVINTSLLCFQVITKTFIRE